jgi:uncharacterized protein (TIGR02118 family)
MHRLVVLYGTPADPAHFRRHYEEVHVPLARQVPGIRAMRYSLDVAGVPANGDGFNPLEHEITVFCAFEAEWDDLPAMVAALGSPEGEAVVADVPNYATGGYLRFHYEV